MAKREPLAYRMCPRRLSEFVGQEEIVGPKKLLSRMIESDSLSSVLFWGPPGTGKTTLAKIISNTISIPFSSINAVTAGVSDIKKVLEETKNPFFNKEGRTVLFVDEIHRFNKAQQDALLPHVENGTIILIGATTENPYFEVNKALLSRSTVFMLKPLTREAVKKILKNALQDKDRGLGQMAIRIEEEALEFLSDLSQGDARVALNALELAAVTTSPQEDGSIHLTLAVARESIQKRAPHYDKDGEAHYDIVYKIVMYILNWGRTSAIFQRTKEAIATDLLKQKPHAHHHQEHHEHHECDYFRFKSARKKSFANNQTQTHTNTHKRSNRHNETISI